MVKPKLILGLSGTPWRPSRPLQRLPSKRRFAKAETKKPSASGSAS